jgi:hypothetical protein
VAASPPLRCKEETGRYDSTIGGNYDAVFCLFEENCSYGRGLCLLSSVWCGIFGAF